MRKYEALSSTTDAKWTLSRPLLQSLCVVVRYYTPTLGGDEI